MGPTLPTSPWACDGKEACEPRNLDPEFSWVQTSGQKPENIKINMTHKSQDLAQYIAFSWIVE